MSSLFGSIVGIDTFCAYLISTGRKARVVKSAPGIDDGFFSRDKNIIELEGSSIDLVTLRMQGALGPRQLLASGSFHVGLGSLPILGKQLLPIQYHYIVRTRFSYPMLDAKLQQETRGMFVRKRVGPLTWSGSFIGPKIAADTLVMDTLQEHTRLDDKLEIHAEPKRGFVRIVHARTCSFDYNVFRDEPVRFHREHAAPALLDAFERIASLLRAPMSR